MENLHLKNLNLNNIKKQNKKIRLINKLPT